MKCRYNLLRRPQSTRGRFRCKSEIEQVRVLHKEGAGERGPLLVMGINVIHRDSPCVIDHKQAVAGSRQQGEPDIGTHLIDAAVVLREGLQVTLRGEAPVKPETDQIGGKVALAQMDKVAGIAAGPGQVRTLANAAA